MLVKGATAISITLLECTCLNIAFFYNRIGTEAWVGKCLRRIVTGPVLIAADTAMRLRWCRLGTGRGEQCSSRNHKKC
jgi:hypothetical protein